MLFGWQGFQLEHPDDWAPVSLTGERKEGYARLVSDGPFSLQIRWRASKAISDLRPSLDVYRSKLARDAKRAKQEFDFGVEESGSRLVYRYKGAGFGRGSILYSQACSRIFFLEVSSEKKESLLKPLKAALDSFISQAGERELWSVLGLSINLPTGLELRKRNFQAGRTTLEWHARFVRIQAERWGFAEQLLKHHELDQWAMAVMSMPKARIEDLRTGVQLSSGRTQGLAIVQPELNQITTLKSTNPKWRPECDWIAS